MNRPVLEHNTPRAPGAALRVKYKILQSILVNRPVLEHNAPRAPGAMGALRVKYYNRIYSTSRMIGTALLDLGYFDYNTDSIH